MVGRNLRKFLAIENQRGYRIKIWKFESMALFREVDNRHGPALRRSRSTAWTNRLGLSISALPSNAKISARCVKPIRQMET